MALTEDAVRGPRDTEIVDHPHSDRTERAMARTRVLGRSQVTTRELPAESSVAADARKAASGPTPSATARPPRASRSGKSLAQSAERRPPGVSRTVATVQNLAQAVDRNGEFLSIGCVPRGA